MEEELYASGFNAWNQLNFRCGNPDESEQQRHQMQQPADLHVFTCVGLRDDSIDGVKSFHSYTSVRTSNGIKTAGVVPVEHEAFRERYGYDGFVEAANGVVVVRINARTINQYASATEAVAETTNAAAHEFPSDLVQIVAYDAGFAALLSDDGGVWTWGDDRYPACLAREVTSDSSSATAASIPGRVLDLDDLPTGNITKLAAGGYILAALTRGRDLYVWGGHPGRKALIEGIGSGPVPVVVSADGSDADADADVDIVDLGVGESHLIVLTHRAEAFVIGDSNSNGQLGLGDSVSDGGTMACAPAPAPSDSEGKAIWRKVVIQERGLPREAKGKEAVSREGTREVVGVAAGPRTSFVITRRKAT